VFNSDIFYMFICISNYAYSPVNYVTDNILNAPICYQIKKLSTSKSVWKEKNQFF